MSTHGEPSRKLLRRSRDERIIAGVCGGVGEYLGVEANMVRLGLGILTVLGGAGIGLYVVGWLLIPEQGEDHSVLQRFLAEQRGKRGQ